MKMIDVLNLMAEGKIEENAELILSEHFGEYEYKYRKDYRRFVDEDLNSLGKRFSIDEDFLNSEVLLEKQIKRYRIKLPNTEVYVGLGYNGVTGRIQTRNYENEQGNRVYVTEVVVEGFTFLEKKDENQNSNQGGFGASQGGFNQGPTVTNDDLPF